MECVFFSFDKEIFDVLNIATLGPSGTSSEQSAIRFGEFAIENKVAKSYQVVLCNTYEEASSQIILKNCQALVVANAYYNISEFYMDNRFNLSAAFLNYTPNYGIAIRDELTKDNIVIATHPAPKALIPELLPDSLKIADIIFKDSTSSAAKAVANLEVDAALTTEVAAKLHKLKFISHIRPIKMLWSVFTSA
ncbi:prephenate decarboxylase [Photorhabdus khanii]|uniref:Bacilysin biosynthesis protein BacA n=1 Tax=Photorhabdus khanii subsp. guanajuatensis TaxID=2100166 RepID=A0A4V2X8Y8_9GAMM|nr:prephenate decarboxylase [Photorhabdus khanii]TDB61635.1 bacilysin biosynthesis protein BacA [Photorhabdus khanii subsp. guanajuatensis]